MKIRMVGISQLDSGCKGQLRQLRLELSSAVGIHNIAYSCFTSTIVAKGSQFGTAIHVIFLSLAMQGINFGACRIVWKYWKTCRF